MEVLSVRVGPTGCLLESWHGSPCGHQCLVWACGCGTGGGLMSRKCVPGGWYRWRGPLENMRLLGCLSLLEFAELGWAPAPFLILLPQVKPFLKVLLRQVTLPHVREVGRGPVCAKSQGWRGEADCKAPLPRTPQASEGC